MCVFLFFLVPADRFSFLSRYIGPPSRWQTRGGRVLRVSRAPAAPFFRSLNARRTPVRFFFFFFSFADRHPFVTRCPSPRRPRSRPHCVAFAFSRRPSSRVALATSPPSRRPIASPLVMHRRVALALAMSPPSRRPVASPCRVAMSCHPSSRVAMSRRPSSRVATRRPRPRRAQAARLLTGFGSAAEMEGCEWVGWKCGCRQ
jgi:hypothetical protein